MATGRDRTGPCNACCERGAVTLMSGTGQAASTKGFPRRGGRPRSVPDIALRAHSGLLRAAEDGRGGRAADLADGAGRHGEEVGAGALKVARVKFRFRSPRDRKYDKIAWSRFSISPWSRFLERGQELRGTLEPLGVIVGKLWGISGKLCVVLFLRNPPHQLGTRAD